MLEIIGLSKSYGNKLVLDNINFKLKNGLYGLLGPNGAGKSTLMNIITDNLLPDDGTVSWKKENILRLGNEYRKILGYMPQQQGLYDGFTGERFLNYIAVLKDVPKELIKAEIESAAVKVNLLDELNKKISKYSGGMKQRLLIASTILGSPELLIFDEPTAGLDPKERVRVKKLIKELSNNKIVIIATHIVPDIESIAKEIIILKKGVLIAKEKPNVLIKKYAPKGNLEDVYMSIFDKGEE